MKSTLTTLAAAIVAVGAVTSVMAQTSPTRAEVKKEAAAENKASATIGTDLSAPEKAAAGVTKKKKAMSDTSRAEVKGEARASNKEAKPGSGEVVGTGKPAPKAPSTVERAEVKAEAKADNKAEKKIGSDPSAPEKKAEGVVKK